MAVTASETVSSSGVLAMSVDQSELAAGTANVNGSRRNDLKRFIIAYSTRWHHYRQLEDEFTVCLYS